jgi:putative tricarboxylic transport membrane protein
MRPVASAFRRKILLALVLWLAGAPASPAEAQPAVQHLRIIAPAAPGGGWDQTARVMQQALQRANLVHTSSVENIPGAAGTIGLARFVTAERGNGDVLMASGLIMLGAIVTHRSPITLHDVTPIARLTGEYEVLVVPAASPLRSLAELVRALEARPEAVSWGGGSAGGTDQILAGLIADAAGVDPRRVNYIAFSGGGESMSAILGGQVTVGVNGLGEFASQIDAGTVRVLGISSANRLQGLDAPTLREQGIDVELENWRSVVAPPGIAEPDRLRLERTIEAMVHSREWRDALARYRWNDRYLAGDAFGRFAVAEEARVQGILRKLGTGRAPVSLAGAGLYPILVLLGLIVTAIAAVRLEIVAARGRRAPAELPWQSLALVASGIVLDLLLIEHAGFVLASTALFWCTARAFDAAHPKRDLAIGLAVSMAAYLVFARLLELPLPPGVLARWI